VQDVELAGVDGGLAVEAEGPSEMGLLAQPGGVLQVRVDAVDGRRDACGSGGEHEVGADVEGLQVAVAGVQVALQVDAAHGQVPNAWHGCDGRSC
jgi:hypothetical protein